MFHIISYSRNRLRFAKQNRLEMSEMAHLTEGAPSRRRDGPFKNPVVVPTVLHLIIPCILLWTKTYNINVICFCLAFSLSFITTVITVSFLCENVLKIKLTYFVVFLDLVIVGVYLAFSITSSDALIAVFCLFYMMGFIWVVQEVRTYLRNVEREGDDEEVIIRIENDIAFRFSSFYVSEPRRGDIECCICYEEIVEGKMLSCGHIYHKECIDEWFKEKRICPYCRHKVDDCRAQAR